MLTKTVQKHDIQKTEYQKCDFVDFDKTLKLDYANDNNNLYMQILRRKCQSENDFSHQRADIGAIHYGKQRSRISPKQKYFRLIIEINQRSVA